jgi:hypothetical protein
LIFAAIALPVLWISTKLYLALIVGYSSGWALDVGSKNGVPWLWPQDQILIFPKNPEFRIRTGSGVERIVEIILVTCLAIVLSSNESSGNIVRSFGNLLGSRDAAIATYQKFGARRKIQVQVKGTNTVTGDRVDLSGELIEVDEFPIISTNGKLYKVGDCDDCQVLGRISTELGPRRSISTKPVTVYGADLSELTSIMNSCDRLSGTLETPEGILLEGYQGDPRQFNPIEIEIAQGTIDLTAASAKDLEKLPNVWVEGELILKKCGSK